MALQKVLFDPRKLTDIGKTSATDFAVQLNKISFNSLTNYFHTIQTALRAAGGFSYSGRSLMTLAVSAYVEVANALCELSTLDTLGNCDSFNINKKDETRRQFGASSRQAGNYSRWYRRTK